MPPHRKITDENNDEVPPRTGLETPLAIVFLVTAALFFVSSIAATRALGVFIVLLALVQYRQGRIAYGWEGRPPSGYLTGMPVTVVSAIFAVAGLALIVWPEFAISMFDSGS